MAEMYNLKGCRVILYDNVSGASIAETKVLDYDRSNQTIVVMRSSLRGELRERVAALVFQHKALYEYSGTLRKVGGWPDNVGYALYKGKAKENRVAMRYTVDAPAVVERLMIAGRAVRLPEPKQVVLRDISTGGCLIEARLHSFNVNTTFQLALDLGGENMLLEVTVVRIHSAGADVAEYGCKF